MRDDTVVFIITHARANEQLTLNMLRKTQYSGKIFLVVDDQDPELELYKEKYKDMVLVFSKEQYWKTTDTFTNQKNLKGAVYARNACADLAREKGFKYFFTLDDDLQSLMYKIPEMTRKKLITKRVKRSERIIDGIVEWLEKAEQIKAIALPTDGRFMGGVNNDVLNGIKYNIVKFCCYRTDSPYRYKSIVYEDMATPNEGYQRGEIAFSFMAVAHHAKEKKNGQTGGAQSCTASLMSTLIISSAC
ncbi:MAG: hypothetical protein Q4B26_07980 [Eubacteriales bacterium]|nr:hypothetical protein [Eubacteriales bacterium]